MGRDAKRLGRQRIQLDARLARTRATEALGEPPRGGWLRAIRESLGMPAEQLGKRLGISKQAVLKIEANEVRRVASLESLGRAARALGCRVTYAIVPDASLEALLDQRAKLVARRKLARVGHSMRLEEQGPSAELDELQLTELANDMKEKLSRELWEEP